MDVSNLISIGIVGSAFAGLMYSFKEIPLKIWKNVKDRFIFTVTINDNDELYYAIEKYLKNNYEKSYRSVNAYLKTSGAVKTMNDVYRNNIINEGAVVYLQDSTIFYINHLGKIILFEKSKKKLEHAQSIRDLFSYEFIIKGFKAKKEISNLLEMISKEWLSQIDEKSVKILIYRFSSWESNGRRNVKKFSEIIIENELKNKIIKDLKDFNERKDWYKDVSIQYKRTYLFYGQAGCGKSTIASAIALELNRNLCILNLGGIQNDDQLINSFMSIPENSVLLLEDIDCGFVRKNDKETISFSCFLNCLDGSMSRDNLITIMTTNFLDKLDSALIRDGRVDVKEEIKPAKTKEIEEYVNLFYSASGVELDYDLSIPMSTVQEICIRNKDSIDNCIKELRKI